MKQSSRRRFLKTSAVSLSAMVAVPVLGGCRAENREAYGEKGFAYLGETEAIRNGVTGLLYSQIGYEPGWPVRLMIRMPEKELLEENAVATLFSVDRKTKHRSSFKYWGEIWKSHWWLCEFDEPGLKGVVDSEVISGEKLLFKSSGLTIEKDVLWNSSVELAAADMLERRSKFTKVGAGWMDAGTLWVESPAQSAMIIALDELIEFKSHKLEKQLYDRICDQITVGCDYLVMLQKEAEKRGYATGSMTHDLHGHEDDILPNDAVKAVVALSRASRVLPDKYSQKKEQYKTTALSAMKWLTSKASPMGDYGLSRFQRGMPEDIKIPNDEWQTRHLMMLCQACIDLWKTGESQFKSMAIDIASQIIERQIPEEEAENNFYGHFYEFKSLPFSENAWTHGIVNNEFGADIGEFYPNYLMPFIEMSRLWADHEDAPRWRNALEKFTYGYLIPACEGNPFGIVPLGIFGNEGPIWFCGTFHGTNAIYGFTAALALELANFLGEPKLKNIAYGNLQWIAGLNSGVTKESLIGSVVYSADIPGHVAVPSSMMFGVGNHWAGTFFGTRGVICNGFSTGEQFKHDVAPKRENDGPFSFTDEDWIPHSAAWLTALVRITE
jgi:hypothetical protein